MDSELSASDWIRILLETSDRPMDTVLGVCRRLGKSFRHEIAKTLAEAVGRLVQAGRVPIEEARRPLAQMRTPAADYVAAHLAAEGGPAWTRLAEIHDRLARPDAGLLLEIARLRRQHDPEGAIADLRLAMLMHPGYSWYIKAEPVIQKLMMTPAWRPARKVRAGLLASSTTALLAGALRCGGFARGIDLEIYQAPYGSYEQEIRDPASGLYAARPEVIVILLNSQDIDSGPLDRADRAGELVRRMRQLWELAQARASCHLVQVGLDLPAPGAWGSLEDTLPEGRRRRVRQANLDLSRDLPTGVSFLDVDSLSLLHEGPWRDEAHWYACRQYPAPTALPVLADGIVAQIAAACGLSGKVLALDLDNTCWAGVVGEDGVEGIRVGPPDAAGEAHAALQRYARQLRQRGVLLTVCSKNNPADAQEAFEQHDGMVLKKEDFAAFTANWRDKASNLLEQAHDLQLGIDSFVFLDDSGLERAWVRRQTGAVVPEAGDGPVEMLANLRRGMFFETVQLSPEDIQRLDSYRSLTEQKKVERGGADLGSFLKGLEMVCAHGPVDDRTLARVTQLVNKTNQFNLTTRRYTAAQVRAMASSGEWWCRWFRLGDRFGDHGLIGVMLACRAAKEWRIDTWLMSCRVLGRQVELFMARQVLSAAAAAGATAVKGLYLPSARNALVKDLYSRVGFQATDEPGEYRFELGKDAVPTCEFVADAAMETPATRGPADAATPG